MEPQQPGLYIGPVFVSLPDEIDITNCECVGAELRAAARPGVTMVIADGSQTTFCDSSGLRQLLDAHQHADANQTELRVICSDSGLLRVMHLMGLDNLLHVYPDYGAALACGSLRRKTIPDLG
jgi:anti-sigma B factor antagonist